MIGGFKRRVLDGFCNRPVIDELLCEQCLRRALLRDGGTTLLFEEASWLRAMTSCATTELNERSIDHWRPRL